MLDRSRRARLPALRPALLAVAASCALAALVLPGCGGSDTAATPTPHTLSGSVAVGAPLSDGRLRVLDAAGNVVASDLVIAEDGRYPAVTLSGSGPWRLEACGYAGADYRCLYAVATAPGTAQVTPLTSAAMLLAGGSQPEALMSGAAATLTGPRLDAAQAQLRNGLGGLLAANNLAANFDFVSGALTAGSRSDYDGLLDALGVNLGKDDKPFVQFTPRLGTGNLYMDADGIHTNAMPTPTSATTLDLPGLQSLVSRMNTALSGPTACLQAGSGLRAALASTAQLSMEGHAVVGADMVAQALCGFFATGEDGSTSFWGSTLLSPTLEDCDFSGAAPVCGLNLVLRDPQGNLHPMGQGIAVTRESNAWRLLGQRWPLDIYASARAQRTQRIDDAAAPMQYDRALSFEIEAVAGLSCAKVEQPTAFEGPRTVAYFKRHPDSPDQRRLALWTVDGHSYTPSLNPNSGFTRQADDSWVILPEGNEGDATIRNFFHGGRRVTITLYSDDACSSRFSVGGRSSFQVAVVGVPPIWSSMETQPWAEADAASLNALRALTLANGAMGSLSAAWTLPHGMQWVQQLTACGSRATCGEGGTGRLGTTDLGPRVRTGTIPLSNTGPALNRDSTKTLAFYGSNGDRVGMQTNYTSCPGTPAGQVCRD